MINDEERRGLLKFVPPNFLPIPVLLTENEKLLGDLREILPAARIALLKKDPFDKVKMLCEEFRADLIDELPTAPKMFEIIIAEDILTTGENFYSMLLALNHLLTDSGMLLTQFYNVRFVRVLENLRSGRFINNERRLWAKADVVKLLDDAIYKEIHFLPDEVLTIRNEELGIGNWIEFGFENFSDDLATKIWLVKACKCTAEVAALKTLFTHETRADLSRTLHRIEYGIEVEENLERLKEICRREGIFDEYLNDFIEQTVIHAAVREFIRKKLESVI